MRKGIVILEGLGFGFLLFMLLSMPALSQKAAAINNASPEINTEQFDVSALSIYANNSGLGILSSDSKPGGLTYGEWSARWWQWAYSLPIDNHPLLDTADCSQGQSGNVWFLGATFTTEQGPYGDFVARVNRQCTVPPDTMLFFPLLSVEGSTLEGHGENEDQMREYAKEIMNHTTDISAEIDGMPVRDLEQYHVQSPLFSYGPLPENNVLQWLRFGAVAGTTSSAVADGIYLMLAPLSVGTHTIHFQGTFKYTKSPDGFDFVFKQDANYQITVQPQERLPRMFMPIKEDQKEI